MGALLTGLLLSLACTQTIQANEMGQAGLVRAETAQGARLHQAKELLGRHFRKVADATDSSSDVNRYVRKITEKSLNPKYKKQTRKIVSTIFKESERYGFDPIFIVSVIQAESSFNPLAKGTSGEIGLMQLMPNTAEWIARSFNIKWRGPKSLKDPETNIRIGAAYLSVLREKFGADGRLYLPAYNMGPTAVNRAVANDVTPVDYARRVMTKYLKNYESIQATLRPQLATQKRLSGDYSDPAILPHSRDDNS